MDDDYDIHSILFLRTMKYDLHTHTKYSLRCGVVEPEDLVKMAISKGLNGIAVTDHDTIKGAVAAKRFETPDFEVIVGCEIKTTNGELIGLYLQEEIISRTPMEVIQEIHDQGGIVVVPHPFDRFRSARFDNISKYLKGIDAIEVFNSRCISEKSNSLARDFVMKCGKSHHLSMVGGSDAHYLNEVGLGYTNIVGSTDEKGDMAGRMMYALQNSKTDGAGRRSSLINHVRTKIQKWSRNCVTHR